MSTALPSLSNRGTRGNRSGGRALAPLGSGTRRGMEEEGGETEFGGTDNTAAAISTPSGTNRRRRTRKRREENEEMYDNGMEHNEQEETPPVDTTPHWNKDNGDSEYGFEYGDVDEDDVADEVDENAMAAAEADGYYDEYNNYVGTWTDEYGNHCEGYYDENGEHVYGYYTQDTNEFIQGDYEPTEEEYNRVYGQEEPQEGGEGDGYGYDDQHDHDEGTGIGHHQDGQGHPRHDDDEQGEHREPMRSSNGREGRGGPRLVDVDVDQDDMLDHTSREKPRDVRHAMGRSKRPDIIFVEKAGAFKKVTQDQLVKESKAKRMDEEEDEEFKDEIDLFELFTLAMVKRAANFYTFCMGLLGGLAFMHFYMIFFIFTGNTFLQYYGPVANDTQQMILFFATISFVGSLDQIYQSMQDEKLRDERNQVLSRGQEQALQRKFWAESIQVVLYLCAFLFTVLSTAMDYRLENFHTTNPTWYVSPTSQQSSLMDTWHLFNGLRLVPSILGWIVQCYKLTLSPDLSAIPTVTTKNK